MLYCTHMAERRRIGPMSNLIREQIEQQEKLILCRSASLAIGSRIREKPEEECPIRTCYQRDRDRILHTMAFRRLKHKTQVFLAPRGDHFTTRLTHTLEVSQIARTIARALQEENNKENRFLLAQTTFLLSKMITGNTSFIYEKTGTEIQHIFIDEFQDTSILQWKNFKVLLEETISNGNTS